MHREANIHRLRELALCVAFATLFSAQALAAPKKPAPKPAAPAAAPAGDAAAKKGMEHGLQKVEVFAKGAGSGKDTAVRSLQAAGLEVTSVKDVTPQAHNGCRPRKRRRV